MFRVGDRVKDDGDDVGTIREIPVNAKRHDRVVKIDYDNNPQWHDIIVTPGELTLINPASELGEAVTIKTMGPGTITSSRAETNLPNVADSELSPANLALVQAGYLTPDLTLTDKTDLALKKMDYIEKKADLVKLAQAELKALAAKTKA